MIGVHASITMGTLRSIRVFVLGEARAPGSYTVSSLSTMTNALLMSGGADRIGSLRNIQLKRKGKIITTLDLYDLLLNGDTSNDARLLPGDVIFIPTIGKMVGIEGEIRRPAIYELNNEKTTKDIIKLAGGFLPTAYPQASLIERISALGNRTLLDVDLTSAAGKATIVLDADMLKIYSVLDTMEDVVMIDGHVKRPGGFAYKKGLRFTDLVRNTGELLANPDLNTALIIRELQPTRKIETFLFNPSLAFTSPKGQHDPVLQARDTVILFNFEDDRPTLLEETVKQLNLQANHSQRRQVTSINGHVRFPGASPALTH